MVASSVVAKLVCASILLLVGAHRVVGQPGGEEGGGGDGDTPVPSLVPAPAPVSTTTAASTSSTGSDAVSPTGSVGADSPTSDTDGSKECDSSGGAANYTEVLRYAAHGCQTTCGILRRGAGGRRVRERDESLGTSGRCPRLLLPRELPQLGR